MSIIDDLDPDALISRLAGPLSPPARAAFRRAAEDALARKGRNRGDLGPRLGCRAARRHRGFCGDTEMHGGSRRSALPSLPRCVRGGSASRQNDRPSKSLT
jgi:hypothetical protein